MPTAMTLRTAYALVLLLPFAALAGPGEAAEQVDPLSAFAAIGETELSTLSGRQGISISDQDLAAITQGGTFAAGDDITTGAIDFGSSMQQMRGVNNQAINTGNNASVNAGVTVQIHMY
jgi:hypothetical protein